jgi:NodT family efflux transporter outer membrane factor (OMF) lipoprotein
MTEQSKAEIRKTKLGLCFSLGLFFPLTFYLCFCFCLFLACCAVGPDFVRPEPPQVKHYTSGQAPAATIPADGQSQHFEEGAKIIADWWQLFSSPSIDAVIKDAIANNPSLQAAQASLRQSQDELRAGYGVFFPQVNASFGATREKLSPAELGQSSQSSNIFNLYTLQATVSYTIDIFGGQRRNVESLQAQVDMQRYTFLGTYLTLSGNIVNAIIAQAAYREQIKATGQIIDIEKEQVGVTEAQVQAGTVAYVNLASLQSQLAATEATLPPLRQKLSQANDLLATLSGHLPAEWTVPQIDLADLRLPGNLPLSLPSELVRQRPDILASEAQLHSASANIGVATAAMFPSFTLSGAYGLSNNSLDNLLKQSSSIWNLGANVVSPIFHGGTLWFMRKAAIDAYNGSLANYRQTVLSGFAQVADTLHALENDAGTLKAQSEAVSASEEALHLVEANYQGGTANYLQVLVANAQYTQAKLGYIQAVAQRYQDTVALFIALGGGWWNKEDLSKP